jgi:hypothetical protein
MFKEAGMYKIMVDLGDTIVAITDITSQGQIYVKPITDRDFSINAVISKANEVFDDLCPPAGIYKIIGE